jgi:5-formyltetrahydrofolate cyclo-ligase
MNPDFTKAALRKGSLRRRQALTPAEVMQRSELLCEQLFRQFPVREWQWVSVFLPLAQRREPNTWAIIQRVWAEQVPVRLAAPVVQPDGVSLRHHELTPTTALHNNRWGIPEPDATGAEVPPAAFDAVLVPLLAVDQAGHRVGYGGGFYDRFLARCRPGAQRIGLSVLDEPPVPLIEGVEPTDVALHACVQPGGVRWF